MSEEQANRDTSRPEKRADLVPARFWPWIVAGLVSMLLKVYTDLQASEKSRVDDARADAKEKIQIQREVTALQRELYFESQKVVAATNGHDSLYYVDSSAANDRQRTKGHIK